MKQKMEINMTNDYRLSLQRVAVVSHPVIQSRFELS